MAKGPSLKTVAEAAGVSATTVSNAYNKPEHLSAELRNHIFAIALDQGYAGPDAAARSLRSGRSGAVGVLFNSQLSYAFSDPYCVDLLAGVAEVAERNRTSMLLIPLALRRVASEKEVRDSVEAVRYAVIDAVVADGIDDGHPALQVLTNRGLPMVRSVEFPGGRCVIIEEHSAARSIGEHLVRLGHRTIAIVTASVDKVGRVPHDVAESTLYPYARSRLTGIREGIGDAAEICVVAAGSNTTNSGRMAAELILKQQPRPTAIAASSDVLALGVLEVLRERGIQVGAQMSVTGFDDVRASAAAGLTTVRQPIREKGRIMGRMLLDPEFDKRRVVLPTRLVIRTSTGPLVE